MFNRVILAALATSIIASPALARFEDEGDFGPQVSDYYVSDASVQSVSSCSNLIDVLEGYKAFLDKSDTADKEQSLLTALTGLSPQAASYTSLPLVACN